MLLGAAAMARLKAARVVIVGLGAVGSYAAEALARAGVGHLRLVDFDEIHPTNLNRQLLALHSTLGRPKVEVARERILDINPRCAVEALKIFGDQQTRPQILAGADALVDAIDVEHKQARMMDGGDEAIEGTAKLPAWGYEVLS